MPLPVITLGVEEELQTVSREDWGLRAHAYHESDFQKMDPAIGKVDTEIHQCVLETQTAICHDADEVVESVRVMRGWTQNACERHNQGIVAAGVHPFSAWHEQELYDCSDKHPHYAHLLHEYGDIARGALSFGMHVHVGLSDVAWRMPIMNRLRHLLPALMAVSANAPFMDGRDTGLCSWRHSILGRYPRMGIPDTWNCDDDYVRHLDRLIKTGCVGQGRGLWEDLRLHHVYGTLEVRIMDTVPDLERLRLIVNMIHLEVLTLALELEQGLATVVEPRMLLEENKWRARRHGMAANMIDWEHDTQQSFSEHMAGFVGRWSKVRDLFPSWGTFERAVGDALTAGTPADRQRQAWAGGSMSMVVQDLHHRTVNGQ